MINRIKKFDDDYLNKFIRDFDLPADTLDRYPNQFSGGQKQKIGIIRALLNKPDVIIFDEPTSGLDVYSQKCILDLINKIKDKYSLTYIFISHNPQVIKYMCDRVFEVEQRKNEVLKIEKKRNIFEKLVKNCLSIKMS